MNEIIKVEIDPNHNLSTHFKWKEYLTSKTTNEKLGKVYYPIIYKHQLPLFEHINYLQERIREVFGIPILNTNAYRDKIIYHTLIEAGYKISKLRMENGKIKGTDHSYLDPEVNPIGVGAVDFVLNPRTVLEEVFQWVQDHLKGEFGQVILYRKARTKEPRFIHLSNPKTLVFNKTFIFNIAPEPLVAFVTYI